MLKWYIKSYFGLQLIYNRKLNLEIWCLEVIHIHNLMDYCIFSLVCWRNHRFVYLNSVENKVINSVQLLFDIIHKTLYCWYLFILMVSRPILYNFTLVEFSRHRLIYNHIIDFFMMRHYFLNTYYSWQWPHVMYLTSWDDVLLWVTMSKLTKFLIIWVIFYRSY